MSRPAPIDTQSPNKLKRLGQKFVSFLSPSKSSFSPTSPEKSQKSLPPFEPWGQLSSVVIPPHELQSSLRHSKSQASLHPNDARRQSRAESHRRSGSRDSRKHRDRSPSRGSQASRRRSVSEQSFRSFDSRRSFESRYTRDEPYRDPDERGLRLEKDARVVENDGIRYRWTNLFQDDRYLGHFYCQQEPRLSTKGFFPGMIIRASHSVFQNDLRATPGDPHITFVKDAAVYSKARPMVVLYPTLSGLCCAPMFSLSGKTRRKRDWYDEREFEYISLGEEGNDWQGDTPWGGVLKFRPDARQRRPLKKECFIALGKTMYVDTQEFLETDLGYLPGDMYNRLIIALDFYQERRKQFAFSYFQEEYKYRGTDMTAGGDAGVREVEEATRQNGRMQTFRPTRDNYTMDWILEKGRKIQELIGHSFRDADQGRLLVESRPVPELRMMVDYSEL